MGVEYVPGDILEATTEAVLNPVNCIGLMGAGLAKQFRNKYPNMFKHYSDACRRGVLAPGRLLIYDRETFDPPFYIINFPTKNDWRQPSKLEYIESGLIALVRILKPMGVNSISVPKLGCGLGELDWEDVNSLIKKYLSDVDCQVMVYAEDTKLGKGGR